MSSCGGQAAAGAAGAYPPPDGSPLAYHLANPWFSITIHSSGQKFIVFVDFQASLSNNSISEALGHDVAEIGSIESPLSNSNHLPPLRKQTGHQSREGVSFGEYLGSPVENPSLLLTSPSNHGAIAWPTAPRRLYLSLTRDGNQLGLLGARDEQAPAAVLCGAGQAG